MPPHISTAHLHPLGCARGGVSLPNPNGAMFTTPTDLLRGAVEQDVSTTMIYAHVLNRGGSGVASPADRL